MRRGKRELSAGDRYMGGVSARDTAALLSTWVVISSVVHINI